MLRVSVLVVKSDNKLRFDLMMCVSTRVLPLINVASGSFEPRKVIKQASNKGMQTKWRAYFSIYHADDGCAHAHAGNEAHVKIILQEYCARTRDYEHGGDVNISSPREWILGADERNQQAATIV